MTKIVHIYSDPQLVIKLNFDNTDFFFEEDDKNMQEIIVMCNKGQISTTLKLRGKDALYYYNQLEIFYNNYIVSDFQKNDLDFYNQHMDVVDRH